MNWSGCQATAGPASRGDRPVFYFWPSYLLWLESQPFSNEPACFDAWDAALILPQTERADVADDALGELYLILEKYRGTPFAEWSDRQRVLHRSEEHTSKLQSPDHLV